MGSYDPRYYTMDKLSPSSIVTIDNSLKRFLRHYDVTDWPIDCFQILDVIRAAGRIHLDIKRKAGFSRAFDAAATYFPEVDSYLIVLKDPPRNWKQYSNWRRCNFTLAHELGHIFCGHLTIPKPWKSREEREREDDEADEFAGRLLMPEKLILSSQFSNIEELSREFLVSNQATFKRLNNLKRLDLLDTPKKLACPKCGNDRISPVADYCDICGELLTAGGKSGITTIGYTRYETNEWNRVLRCLVCENEEFSIGASYCRICGTPLYNQCDSDDFFSTCNHVNSAGARFCELCGSKTVYYRRRILNEWKDAKAEYIRSVTQG